jgi:hypothetical protein
MGLLTVLAALPIIAFVFAHTPVPALQRIGKVTLLIYTVAAAVLTLGMASMVFFVDGNAGIGSSVFLVMAAFPGFLAWLGWQLYKGVSRPEGEQA